MASSKNKTLDILCPSCEKENSRRFSWIDTKQFSDPNNANLISTFFCAFCSKGLAVKIAFRESGEIEFLENIEYKSLINENSPAFWYEDGLVEEEEDDEEKVTLSDDDLLTLLRDPPVND